MSATTTTSQNRIRLLEILRERSFLKRDVVLSSGKKSDWYVDGKMISVCPEGAHLIGELFYEVLENVDFDAIGGLETGAIPIVASFVNACYRHERDVEGFWVRNEAKLHGTQKLVEGNLKPNSRVVIVDDVVTSGRSVQKAIEAIEAKGCTVVKILSIVDRESGSDALLTGYDYESLFNKKDFHPND